MLFSEIEVQKRRRGNERPPILPPPGFGGHADQHCPAACCGLEDSRWFRFRLWSRSEAMMRRNRMLQSFALSCTVFALLASPHASRAQSTQSAPSAKDKPAPVAAPVPAPSAAVLADPLLKAMREELDRSRLHLKMDGVPAPYYIEYRLADVDQYEAEAIFGALRSDQHVHARSVRIVVRVGDYKQDSYYGPGVGVVDFAPLDNDEAALRRELWFKHRSRLQGRKRVAGLEESAAQPVHRRRSV